MPGIFTFTFTFTREHNRIAKKINPLVWGELRKMWKTLFIGWRLERIAQLGEELVYQVTIFKISGLSIFPSKSCNCQQKHLIFCKHHFSTDHPTAGWGTASEYCLQVISHILLFYTFFKLCTSFCFAFIAFFFSEYLPIVLGKKAYGDLGEKIQRVASDQEKNSRQKKDTKYSKIPGKTDTRYDPKVDPSVLNEFATVAFR